MYLKRIKEQKEARAQAKELSPSTEFLFGGQIKNLSQDIKASGELNPLAITHYRGRGGHFLNTAPFSGGRGSGAGGSFSRFPMKSRGGGKPPMGRGSFSNRGNRLSKFKEN